MENMNSNMELTPEQQAKRDEFLKKHNVAPQEMTEANGVFMEKRPSQEDIDAFKER